MMGLATCHPIVLVSKDGFMKLPPPPPCYLCALQQPLPQPCSRKVMCPAYHPLHDWSSAALLQVLPEQPKVQWCFRASCTLVTYLVLPKGSPSLSCARRYGLSDTMHISIFTRLSSPSQNPLSSTLTNMAPPMLTGTKTIVVKRSKSSHVKHLLTLLSSSWGRASSQVNKPC